MIIQERYTVDRAKLYGHDVIRNNMPDGRAFSFGKEKARAIVACIEQIKQIAQPAPKPKKRRASDAVASDHFKRMLQEVSA